MDLGDKVIVITGAGSGIGEAMARRFDREKPRGLVLADLDERSVAAVAGELEADARVLDVSDEVANRKLIEETEDTHGPIDLFCANAGYAIVSDEQAEAEAWHRMWLVNVMSHVYAAKYLVPGWVARGEGYFLATASAAGLLTNLKAAQYSVTKHAAVAFAEWLAITYGDRGVRVSCLCPQFVETPLLRDADEFKALGGDHVLQPQDVAESVIEGLGTESFLILPHPEVETFFQNKANDYDRWIGGMRKLQRSVFGS